MGGGLAALLACNDPDLSGAAVFAAALGYEVRAARDSFARLLTFLRGTAGT